MPKPPTILSRDAIVSRDEIEAPHPLNPKSGVRGLSLSDAAGLERIGFHLLRLPSGKEANELHTHRFEEEFYFVLEGRGVLLVGDESHDLGPGSFAAFPAPSPPHLLTNPHDEDLVYLCGGERRDIEIAEFPRLGKVSIRARSDVYLVDADDLQSLSFPD